MMRTKLPIILAALVLLTGCEVVRVPTPPAPQPPLPPGFEEYRASAKRFVGAVILLLGLSMLVPIPLGHIPPAMVIMLLAFALLEEDGVLLVIALAAAVGSLGVTGVIVWGTILGIEALD